MDSTKHFLEQIDWQRPWLAPFLPIANPILAAQDWRQAINVAAAEIGLRNHRGLPVRFVMQEELPPGMAYEAYISETGCVPTRDNLHDFFNALVWLTYPQVKVQLNALQAAEIVSAARSGAKPAQRGKVRDAATIFDENAALFLFSDASHLELLRNHQWHEALLIRRREFGRSTEVCLFGHALMEKLLNPYKAITAHAWAVAVDPAFFAMDAASRRHIIDCTVAVQLSKGLTTSDFSPLPVLGIPDWWEGQDKVFYEDATVFRPKRPTHGMTAKPT